MELINGLGGAAGFGENFIDRNNSGDAANVNIRSTFGSGGLNFLGHTYTSISINNYGIAFGTDGISSYTSWGMQTSSKPMIAAFFADVDTMGYTTNVDGPGAVTATPGGTSTGSNLVWYDLDATGYGTLTVTWDDVGYFNGHIDKLNAFQMRLIGTGGGNFNIEFRYEVMNWTTGDASGGTSGLGGTIARAGYSAGDGTTYYELVHSGVQSQMLDLEVTEGNTYIAGQYFFSLASGGATDGVINGTDADNILTGGAGNDTIYGMSGNDQLDGGGGADLLYGGIGNDLYFVVDNNDTIFEDAGGGTDTIQSSITYSLVSLPNVENIRLTGTANINATGNDHSNMLISNGGANVLNGGIGTDIASFELSHAAVTASLLTNSATGDGSDTFISIENLVGSIYNDSLTGNNSNNVLDGLNGVDTLTGLGGADIYMVDNVGDVVVEAAGDGIDTVYSSVTYTLSANVEHLQLYGTLAINGTGNAADNVIRANNMDNTLSGLSGNDQITGEDGNDTAVYRGNFSDYTISYDGATALFTVHDNVAGRDGTDSVKSVEFFQFADVTKTAADVIPLVPMVRNGISFLPDRYAGPATTAWGQPIHFQFIGDSSNEVVQGTAYNDFINVAGGDDAVNGGAGQDVIDGGVGSNFLTGGEGIDIFFSDGRGGVTIWSTITDWEDYEQLSVWGWQPGVSRIVAWVQAGAAGYEGLTMHADLNGDGTIDTSVTFTGITSQSQLPAPLEFDGVLWFVEV